MCGRFVGFRKLEELTTFFPIDEADCNVTASYNIAPASEVLAIVRREGRNHLSRFHWGLVPFWARDTAMGSRMINARSETVAEKPAFRYAFERRRCLVPADGFYEWTGKKGKRQPVYITLPEEPPFAFAAIWESWLPPDRPDTPYLSCALLTTAASPSMQQWHHRMPVILHKEAWGRWLDPDNRHAPALLAMIRSERHTEFVGHPVSNQVNRPKNDHPSNIRPLEQQELF